MLKIKIHNYLSSQWFFLFLALSAQSFEIKPVLLSCSSKPYLSEERKIFIDSFTKAYEQFSLSELGVSQLHKFLNQAFEDEKESFLNRQSNKKFFHVLDNESADVVAFFSLEIKEHPVEMIYISTLVVSSLHWRQGIGEKIIEFILDEFPDAQLFHLATRKINQRAIDFYTKLGFELCDIMGAELDSEKYLGLCMARNR